MRGVMREGISVEFKREWSEGVKKTMVAFANTNGGEIYLGVSDDGEAVGIENPDQCVVKAMQAASNAIRPDITLCTQARVIDFEGKALVKIEVQRGASRPYYLAEKGIRPAGVYVRQGAMSAPASESAILSMIKESSNDVFDAGRSTNQELTFFEVERAFATEGIAFGEQQMKTLGFLDDRDTYTNAALLFSDQCPSTVKGALFQGKTKEVFKNRFEFSGSILRQFREVLEFIDRCNMIRSEIGADMKRIDTRDYPESAIREALLNMFVHRDYSVSAPALVSVLDDRVEFVNFGGLVAGMSEDDMMLGVSLQRNPRVSGVFYRLKWVEAYGTGIPKMLDSYKDVDAGPNFAVASNSFRVALPSMASLASREPSFEKRGDVPVVVDCQEGAVMALLRERGAISRQDIEKTFGLTRSPAGDLLARMQEAGMVRRTGRGKNTRYVAN